MTKPKDEEAAATAALAEAGLAPKLALTPTQTFAPTDARAAMEEILRSIEQAESLDEVLSAGELDDTSAVLDRPLIITDWSWRHSQRYGQPYSILKVADAATGEAFVVACGGEIVAFQLTRIEKLIADGKLDRPITGLKMISRETANGYNVLKLVKVDA